MGETYGWVGHILRVILSTQKFSTVPTMQYTEFIGGLGINQYLLLHELAVEADPLSSENHLIFGAGPLVGTPAFSSLENINAELLENSLSGNLKSVVYLSSLLLEEIQKNSPSAVVTVLSSTALTGRPREGAYAAAKWGARRFSASAHQGARCFLMD